jgi:uncharacterized protein
MHGTYRVLLALAAGALLALPAQAQQKRLSIATGGTGGVYYPMGGAIASVVTKNISGVEATAEVTSASVDNMRLIGAGKADIAFTLADTAWDAYTAGGKFKEKLPVRALAVIYTNQSHWVTVDGSGIEKMADLKGKRIATGAAGSGTEVIALRILEAYGIDPEKDVKREKLSVAESVNAIKDRKIDAFFWSGGVPTAAVTDLAATPGMKIRILDHADTAPALAKKYGPIYVAGRILAKSYPGQDKDAQVTVVWNLLVVHENMDEGLAYQLARTIFEKKADLVATHKEAQNIVLETQLDGGSPIPFHPGVLKYLAEKGIKAKQ